MSNPFDLADDMLDAFERWLDEQPPYSSHPSHHKSLILSYMAGAQSVEDFDARRRRLNLITYLNLEKNT